MKSASKLFALIALVILGFSLAACGQRVDLHKPDGKINPSRAY